MRSRARPALVVVLAACLALVVEAGVAAAGATAQPSWAALHRPLKLEPLAAGASCPVSPLRKLDRAGLRGPGRGPIYPVGGVSSFSTDSNHPDWIASKTIWAWPTALKSRATRILVRGYRLDQPGVVRFQLGPQWDSAPLTHELRLDTTQTVGSFSNSTWGTTVTLIFVQMPGCYALQLDSERGTSTIVVRAGSP